MPRLVILVDDNQPDLLSYGPIDRRQVRFRQRLAAEGICIATVDEPEQLATVLLQGLNNLTVRELREKQRADAAAMRDMHEQLAAAAAAAEQRSNDAAATARSERLKQMILERDREIERRRAAIAALDQQVAADQLLVDRLTGVTSGVVNTAQSGIEPAQFPRWRSRSLGVRSCVRAIDRLLDATLMLDRAVDFTAALHLDLRDPDDDPALQLAGHYGRNELMAHYLADIGSLYDLAEAPEFAGLLANTSELSRALVPLREYCARIGRELRRARPRFRRVVHLTEQFNRALTRAQHYAEQLNPLLADSREWDSYRGSVHANVRSNISSFLDRRVDAFVALRTLQNALDDQTGSGDVPSDALAAYADSGPAESPVPADVGDDAVVQARRFARASIVAVLCQAATPALLGIFDRRWYTEPANIVWIVVAGIVLAAIVSAAGLIFTERGSGTGLYFANFIGLLTVLIAVLATVGSGHSTAVAIGAGLVVTIAEWIARRRYWKMNAAFRRNSIGRRQQERAKLARVRASLARDT